MPTYRTTARNRLRTPSGAVGEAPDGPGALATLADDVELYLGTGGAESVADAAARDAIPANRIYTDKRVRVAADGITYVWTSAAWAPYSSQWVTFTPTFTGFTLGNGIATAYYKVVEGVCFVYVNVSLGSTSAVTGPIDAALPIAPVSGTFAVGTGQLVSGATIVDAVPEISGSNIRLRARTVSGTNVVQTNTAAAVPFTWASGNSWNLRAAYRV